MRPGIGRADNVELAEGAVGIAAELKGALKAPLDIHHNVHFEGGNKGANSTQSLDDHTSLNIATRVRVGHNLKG